jgi:transcriptional regulator GlxA family with amidase domain
MPAMANRADKRYRDIISRFEQAATAELPGTPTIANLCATLAVTHRSLLRAFKVALGTTPSSHLRTLRLKQARNALLSSGEPAETVTEVAMRFGFRELGRLAADYRVAFGERPSDTLRRRKNADCRHECLPGC